MRKPNIKTCKLNSPHDTNHFFILSKGYNAGKPLEKPCPNCFIVTGDNEEHKNKLYWISYSIWKSGAYNTLLSGSIIPFLSISDVAAEIEKAIRKVKENPVAFDRAVTTMGNLMHTEKLLNFQLKLIDELKHSVARKFHSKK